MNNNTKKHVTGHQLGIFILLAYIVCMIWYAIHPEMRELHLDIFRLTFLGFSEMNVISIAFGAVQSYLWGHVGIFLWNFSKVIAKV